MHTIHRIFDLLTVLLPLVGIWIAVFRTPLIPHLVELLITKEPMTEEDVQLWLTAGGRFRLLQLYCCVWCQAWWLSLLAGSLYAALLCPEGWLTFPFYAVLVYPLTCYLLWKLKRLENN